MEWLTGFIPEWLKQWFNIYIVPLLKLELQAMWRAMKVGILDALLFLGLPLAASLGSQAVWNARYHLSAQQQAQVEQYAGIAQIVAYMEDVPPVVPLVLWFKENGLQAVNPNNCEGIMGMYTAVRTGKVPCFPPGPVGAEDVAYQLQLGTRTFKSYCPELSFRTTDMDLIKTCYLRYNAGPATRTDPDNSAYVMNGYDQYHDNMLHTEVTGRQYRLTSLGAWPAHLAIQSQLAQRDEMIAPAPLMSLALMTQEIADRVMQWAEITTGNPVPSSADVKVQPGFSPLTPADPQHLGTEICLVDAGALPDCFIEAHVPEDVALSPSVHPLLVREVENSQPQCKLLPGIDLTPVQTSVVRAPLPGELTRYADALGHLAVQIENDEWIVWITGLRSYTTGEGPVAAGKAIGAVGGAGTNTPTIHYAVYDKQARGYIYPLFIEQCLP